MNEKTVLNVSDITKMSKIDEYYCCGFTVTFADGEIRNYILKSRLANDPLMQEALKKKWNTFSKRLIKRRNNHEI